MKLLFGVLEALVAAAGHVELLLQLLQLLRLAQIVLLQLELLQGEQLLHFLELQMILALLALKEELQALCLVLPVYLLVLIGIEIETRCDND